MSDRIGVMNAGRLLQVGAPEEIYERPSDRFVADFIGDTSFLSGVLRGPGEIELDGGLLVSAVADSGRPGDRVTLALRPEGLSVAPTDGAIDERLNRVRGRVRRRIYAGTTIEYEVDLGGATLRVRVGTAEDGFRPGDEVVVAWAPETARILPEDR